MDTVISMDAVSKRFGKKRVLKEVDLQVKQGAIFGFLGPNGAGKTTTIRCLMDFIRPNKGTISIFGKDANKHAHLLKKDIGYLPAESQLMEKWNSRQHLDFYTSVKRKGNLNRKIFSDLDLDPKIPVKYLSSGNRQKLGFILSLIGSPKLLILDEPTRGLDPLLQNDVYKILRLYADHGGTVFISSHNLEEVERICTDIAIIREGVIVADKSLEDIKAMKTHIVSVYFDSSQNIKLSHLPGISVLDHGINKLTLKVQGDINPILKELVKHKLNNLEITHPPLEEVFMDYYRK
ncbi:MAG: ABC transporter ATP-binding protein [Candidatus Saccharimonadales bacterium]